MYITPRMDAVQAALPRLLGAAASPGVATRENRRQCLKVLRLWLERKILPESLLRQYMDDIGVSNDDVSAGFFLQRPSRAERAVDGPIRDMEGMLVDKYGRVTNLHQGYGFVEFRSEDDADYAYQDKQSLDVGANLFVGNLDPDVDEKLLYDTFSAFGVIVTNPKVHLSKKEKKKKKN
ncbi:hypothetical protein HYC85_021593 [Camellia sinensis]|uniref:RRM domain-containing protein n=1 Tax=Camellia sinensis TaxID=4442 RepID=A0A7J7GLW1_CAMSI|nr:hypothetical protein HYC85_021593 [Camellia sinensis]